MGQGRTCARIEGNPNSNCCGRVRESKIKLFRKVAVKSLYSSSTSEFVNDFTVKLPCKVTVKSLGSLSAMGTLFCLLLYISDFHYLDLIVSRSLVNKLLIDRLS